ncbi:MAG: hypothetical protein LBH00_11630 [Planctomycetaceae bacterium]|jgi:Leucine-rich repeat (LRR) protein|nr:hypothetical protein [Planctomycetaceae bacterium]
MRQILFFTLSLLMLTLFSGCPPETSKPGDKHAAGSPRQPAPPDNTAKAADGKSVPKPLPPDAEQIQACRGKFTLTPANTLKSVTFDDGKELKPSVIDLLAKQSDLETLQIADYRDLNDGDVAKLAGLKKLTTLKLTNSGISDAAAKTIADSFPDLINLDVSSNPRLTNAALKEFGKLKKLESLLLLFCNFDELGMMSIASLPNLKTLDIRSNQVGDTGLGMIAGLPGLKNLKHRTQSVSDEGIKALSAAKNLESLLMQDFLMVTEQSGQYLREMEALTSLEIFRCENFNSAGVLQLKGLKLNRLTLRQLTIDDSAMEVFREMPALKRLYLNELSNLSDAGMENLSALKNLEVLEIGDVPITDKALESIAKIPSLKTLSLQTTNITDAGLEQLLNLPKLETLTFKSNPKVTPSGIGKIKDKIKDSKKKTKVVVK